MNDLLTIAAVIGAAYVGYRLYQKYKKPCCADCAGGAETCGDGGFTASGITAPSTIVDADPFAPAKPIGLSADVTGSIFGESEAKGVCN